MAASLILPRRYSAQPQQFAPVAGNNLSSGLRGYWMAGGERSALVRNRVTGRRAISSLDVAPGYSQPGRILSFGFGNIDTGEAIDINGAEITFALRLRLPSSSTRRLFGNHENATTGYLLYQDGLSIGCYVNNTLVVVSPALTPGKWTQVAIACFAGYKIAVIDGVVTNLVPGTVAVSGTGTSVKIGSYNWQGHPDFTGDIEYIGVWDRGLSPNEMRALQANPYRLLQPPRRRAWIEPLTAHVLTGGGAVQANTLAAVPIAQTHGLAVAPLTQAATLATGEVVETISLTVSASIVENTAGEGAIGQSHLLAVTAAITGNTVPAVSITQIHPLAGSALDGGQAASTGAIQQTQFLVSPGAVQANPLSAGAVQRTLNFVIASLAQANQAQAASISDGTVAEPDLATGTQAQPAIKKPGIPADTAGWLRTMLEIFTGRRNNKITPATIRELTFSATPTQAECEALYAYVNETRRAVNELIRRFDS